MSQKISLDTYKKSLEEALEFLEAFVDYHVDEPSVEAGELTDAQILQGQLPILKNLLNSLGKMEEHVGAEYTYSDVRHAAESVNPHFKYCVFSSNQDYLGVTDDLQSAMQNAKTRSLMSNSLQYVLEIKKVKDGTFKTFKLGHYHDGQYYGNASYGEDFLHFNYLESIVANINKI